MKKLLILVITSFALQSSFCQMNNIGDWMINFNLDIEENDKRLFDYSGKESLLTMQPESFGTYNVGIIINKTVWKNKKLSSTLGLGVGYEKATFLRPFDHSYFMKDSFRILRNLHSYTKVKTPLSFKVFYKLRNNWYVTGSVTSNLLLFRSINNSELNGDVFPYTESTFELDDINLHLGINYQINNILIGLELTILNFQKIDKIIFNDIIKDPRVDQKWEWDNPISGRISFGYTL